MKEEVFRYWIIVWLAVFVVGFLTIGFRFADNHRYVQFAHTTDAGHNTMLLDTRTGQLLDPQTGNVKLVK